MTIEKKTETLLVMILMFLGVIALFLTLVHNVPFNQVLLFYLGTIFFFFLPGCLALDLLKWKDNPVSFIILATLAGMALSPVIFYLTGIIEQARIFPLLIFPAAAYTLFSRRRFFVSMASPTPWCLPRQWWKGLVPLVVILALLHVSHFSDLGINEDGSCRLRNAYMTETVYHLGIINVAEHTLPPFFPYASGYSFAEYHIDMHLQGVLFTRFLGIDALIVAYYFLPLLFMFMLVAVPAVFFYDLHGNLNFSLFFGLLIFSADLSFIPALWKEWPSTYPWTLTFCTSIWGLFTLNGIMPAIPLLFGALTAFQRYFTSRRISDLILFSVFAFGASRIKSSMGPQIVATAFPALAFIVWRNRPAGWWKPLLVFIGTALIVFLDMSLRSHAAPDHPAIRWYLFAGVMETAARLGYGGLIECLRYPLDHPFAVLTALILYVAGFMGVRLIILKYLRDIFRRTGESVHEVVPYLIFFVLGGVVLSECIFIGCGNDTINNGVWFRVQAIIAATYFVAAYLVSIRSRAGRFIAVIIVIALSFPSTLQFLFLRHDPGFTLISRDEMQLVNFIKREVPDTAVVLEFPFTDRPSPAAQLAGRRSVLLLVPARLHKRYADCKQFERIYYNNEWCFYGIEEK